MTENLIKKFPSAWEQLKDGEKEKVFSFSEEGTIKRRRKRKSIFFF